MSDVDVENQNKRVESVFFNSSTVPLKQVQISKLRASFGRSNYSEIEENIIEGKKINFDDSKQTSKKSFTKTKSIMDNLDSVMNKTRKSKSIRSIQSRTMTEFELDELNESFLVKLKSLVRKYLDNNIQLAVMSLLTLFALLGPDIRTMVIEQVHDPIFNGFFIWVMFMFFFEFLANIWVKDNYFKSFYFWLDLFVTISMFLEIDWILYPMVNLAINWSFSKLDDDNKGFMVESVSNRKLMMTIRILRIIRLIRIVKLYKAVIHFVTNLENKVKIAKLAKKKFEREKVLKKKEEEKRRKETLKSRRASKSFKNRKTRGIYGLNSDLMEINKLTEKFAQNDLMNLSPEKYQAVLDKARLKEIEDTIELSAKSNISKAASERITQKVIMVILLMLFLAPLTDDDVYSSSINSTYLMVCRFINNIFSINGGFGENYKNAFESYLNSSVDSYYPIIHILYNSTIVWSNNSFSENVTFRTDEKSIAYISDGLGQIEYSTQALTKLSASINLCRTFFVIFTLSYMAVVLETDLKQNVLTPLETMIDLVDSVAKDPVNYKNIESLKIKIKNSMNKKKGPVKRDSSKKNSTENNQSNPIGDIKGAEYEIKVIELAIIKISALLAIGFGEAGGEILRENISSQEGLNPMIAGKKKAAIFGFCDIRHFPDINVALQEKTMVFVNEIADIVHSCVDKFAGSTNKNIGDAFLLIWKFPHLEKILENEESQVDPMAILQNADPISTSLIADQAVLGYLNIIKKINKSPTILAYKKNADIKAKFGDSFKVQMGFGLHVGWGIEGPIGSFYKIDCSYLSPNVNISARLEGATRQYGVTILISGELYDLLSDELKNICRLIDIVTVKGSKFPLRLYTIYVNENLKPDKAEKDMSMKEKRKFYANKKEKLKEEIANKNGTKFILQKKGFKELLTDKRRPALFYEKFREGFNNYISGNWEKSYKLFKDAIFLDPNDGPTKTLMNFIKKNNKKAPDNWKGYRELTSK